MAGYQNEPYLPKALDSIARQTFPDFEAICYVKESTDNSLTICQHFAENDKRFKVVSAPKSGGVSSTRNYGIEHAKGEYLVVIDGDDWVVTDMLEKLHRKLKENQPLDVLSFAALMTSSDDVNSMKMTSASVITNFKPEDATGVFPDRRLSGVQGTAKVNSMLLPGSASIEPIFSVLIISDKQKAN